MQERLMYVENKSAGHGGEAWIGFVSFSKTGSTVYFNGRAYGRVGGRGISGNFADSETGEEFWISGVKKRGTNRHRFGSGIIRVDRRAVPALLKQLGATTLDRARFVTSDAADTSSRRRELHERENTALDDTP